MLGRALYVVTKWAGSSTTGFEAVGQTVISVDSVRDFILDSGFVVLNDSVRAYTSVDRINSTITLATPLTSSINNGTDVRIYPVSRQRWVYVETDSSDTPSDAVWAQLPHALSALVAEDGPRSDGDCEVVVYERAGQTLIVTDVKDRVPQLNADAIPDGLITETKIAPESITTPLLATNAVATQNLQFGAATGDKLSADSINGKTIIGPIIKTSDTGERTEMKPSGIQHIDASGNVDVQIGSDNKFTGVIEALSAIIQNSFQMFGKDNLMGIGSKLTLKAGAAAPFTAPVMSYDYEPGPSISPSGWFPTGVHTDAGGSNAHITEVFLSNARYTTPTGKWTFPQIPYQSGTACEFKPWSMVRIAKQDNDALRTVMIGEDYNHIGGNGYPETWLRIYDPTPMVVGDTVAPTKKYETKIADFSYFKTIKLFRLISNNANAWKSQFGIAVCDSPLTPGIKNLSYAIYQYSNADNTITQTTSTDLGGVIASDEDLVGCIYGLRGNLNLDATVGASTDAILIVMTTKRNMIRNVTTSTWVLGGASAWPLTFNPQERMWAAGSVTGNSHTDLYNYNWGAGSDVKTYKYTNEHRLAASTLWGTYVWRGEAATAYRTPMAPLASIGFRSRARLKVSMPALPAPSAGVGAARDPAKDVYGWVYFLGAGSTPPARTAMFQQANTPALASNTPLAVSSVTLDTYPVLSGTNPPSSNNFPTAAPATIESDNGSLIISGDGKVTADEILGNALDKLVDLISPIGSFVIQASSVAPYRTLLCDGSAVSRTTYAALFAKIGTSHGAGNGTTTFNLPRLQGRSFIGVGLSDSPGAAMNYTLGQKWGDERLQAHLHGSSGMVAVQTGAAGQIASTVAAGGSYGFGYFNPGSEPIAGAGTTGNIHPVLAEYVFIRY